MLVAIRRRLFVLIVAGTTFAGLSGAASADLIFSFSWDNSTGNTAGPIEGFIFGLVDNEPDQRASEITLTNVGGHADSFPYDLPFDVLGGGWLPNPNLFTVEEGEITSWDAVFVSGNPGPTGAPLESLDFGATGQFQPAFETDRGLPTARITEPDLDAVRFSQVTIPEPSSLLLLGLSSLLAGVAVFRRRR